VSSFLYWVIILLAITIIISLKILREDERFVIIRLGRFFKIAGPGLVIILPFIDRGIRMSLSKDFPQWREWSKTELDEKIKSKVVDHKTP
jgi:regulator of protease activity HflC (stomatin/prohibitin superfamily)